MCRRHGKSDSTQCWFIYEWLNLNPIRNICGCYDYVYCADVCVSATQRIRAQSLIWFNRRNIVVATVWAKSLNGILCARSKCCVYPILYTNFSFGFILFGCVFIAFCFSWVQFIRIIQFQISLRAVFALTRSILSAALNKFLKPT